MVIMPHPESQHGQPIQGSPSHLPSPVIRQNAVAGLLKQESHENDSL